MLLAKEKSGKRIASLSLLERDNISSGTEESYLLSSEGSIGNDPASTKAHCENDSLLPLSYYSNVEEPVWIDSSPNDPLLNPKMISSSGCLCMPTSRRGAPVSEAARSR